MLDTDRDDHEASRGERRGRAVPEFIGQGSLKAAEDFRLIVPVPVNSLGGLDEDRRQSVDVGEAKRLAVQDLGFGADVFFI